MWDRPHRHRRSQNAPRRSFFLPAVPFIEQIYDRYDYADLGAEIVVLKRIIFEWLNSPATNIQQTNNWKVLPSHLQKKFRRLKCSNQVLWDLARIWDCGRILRSWQGRKVERQKKLDQDQELVFTNININQLFNENFVDVDPHAKLKNLSNNYKTGKHFTFGTR